MDGKEIGGLLRVLMYAFKALLFILKIAHFVGLTWFFVPIAFALIYEWVSGNYLENSVVVEAIFSVMVFVCFVLAPLTLLQNLIRMIKKDRTFSIAKAILNRTKKKGFEAKLGGDTVALASAGDVSGFVFGKKGGKYVTMPEATDGHVLVIGGAGSGKTAGVAIPTLMSWRERVFAIDIKGELYQKTKAARTEAQIKVFNPTDPNAHGYDPFFVLKHSAEVPEEARALALSICPLPAEVKDPFWIQSAQNMLTGFLVYFFHKDFSFSETMKAIKSRGVKKLITEIMEGEDEQAIAEVSQFDGMDDKTLSGVFTELSNHITIFATSADLQRALSGHGRCITPADLENGYDVYCCIPEHKLEQWKELMGMLCNQFLKSFERRPDGNTKPILFLIDEFPRLGKIETISNGLATLRSKKIHIALFVQSKSQLNAIYGKDVAEVIADNCSYKAILKASEPNTQEWCSKLVGTYDKKKLSSNYNADVIGIGKGQGTSKTEEEKKIIKPEEFAYLQDVVCLFPNGYRRIDKAYYFKDKTFSNRV